MIKGSKPFIEKKVAYSIEGISLASIASGIRYKDRNDLVLIKILKNSNVVGVFTRNIFCAAPVLVSKEHLELSNPQYLIINSGNANAGTGDRGIDITNKICSLLAEETGCAPHEVLPFSTGVIGEDLPISPFKDSLALLLSKLKQNNWENAASAIMTTDKVAKYCATKVQLSEGEVTFTGICKGSGMICPNMATMLAFIATDAQIGKDLLQDIMEKAIEPSFNSISVDGDSSTNDSCILIATGASNIEVKRDSIDEEKIQYALSELCMTLAKEIILDGEGATKFVEICVTGASSLKDAREVGYLVANSPLVKTAIFASDPNWGRIIAAIGAASNKKINTRKLTMHFDSVLIFKEGRRDDNYKEEDGKKIFLKDNFCISINLGMGEFDASILTCDLSHEYVQINADYRS
tara:strand:+ start:24558 stop:25781 length:1224 start_codon:yes stop_codon:yes gene_type:complete